MSRSRRSKVSRRRWQRGVAILLLVLLIAGIVAVMVLGHRITTQFEGRRWTLPARVYAQPMDLYVGQEISAERLAAELRRLGYLPVDAVGRPGTFQRRGDRLEVFVREFRFSDELQPAQRLRIGFQGRVIASMRDPQGEDMPVVRLDPLLIGSIFPIHGEDRIVVAPDAVPAMLPAALKTVEDRKFDQHLGVDPLAILRALFANIRAGQVEQGGSTLTQQLVKSYFLDSRRTLRRKAEEAVMAVILDARFEKADIMNAYINEIYLGQDGRRAIHGFGLASQFYFGKPVAELDLHEVALLVAIVRGPSYYDPRRHPERATERRNLVLRLLAEQGVITSEEAAVAAAKPLDVSGPGRRGSGFFPAFLDLVRRQLRSDYREEDLTEAGLTVFTTLDPLLQEKAEASLSEELERQDKSPREEAHGLEGVVVVTAPQTGEVVAMIGGRNAAMDGFNRALDARRPIGSLAKPVVYLSALETGDYNPASIVADAPVEIRLPSGDIWQPNNFDKQVNGPVPMVQALARSLNLATVNLGMEVGLGRVSRTFEALGLEEAPPEYPSMLLGAVDLSPLEVAQVYNSIANGGFRSPLRAVRAVIDENGEALKAPELEVSQAASPESVYVLERMMVEVMERGTGRAARRQLPGGLVVAGKTGTSNDYRDSWFAGFSGSHLIVVWIGHDDNAPTALTGTTGALPVWTRLMSSITTSSFEPLMPEDVEDRWIDYYTGYETSPFCAGAALRMPFVIGTRLPRSESCEPGQSVEDDTMLLLQAPDRGQNGGRRPFKQP
jgi:penicillin-binding protein 1B